MRPHRRSQPLQSARAWLQSLCFAPLVRWEAPGEGITLKALTLCEYGIENLQVEEIDPPEPSPGEVRIAVHASAVNPADWLLMSGSWMLRGSTGFRRPRSPIPGMDVAGIVDAVGSEVREFAAGDEVYGELRRGAFAEQVCTTADRVARRPKTLTFEQAAAAPLAGLTALHAIRDVGAVKPGQHVLVIGASGGVGTFAVQVAKAIGAEVTGVCSTESADLVRSIGADHVVDYKREEITDTTDRFDLVLDNVASNSLGELRQLLNPTGVVIANSANGGVRRMLWAGLLWKVGRRPFRIFISKCNRADLDSLSELLSSGAVTPVIDRSFPLTEARDAVAYAATGHAHGKVVISCR